MQELVFEILKVIYHNIMRVRGNLIVYHKIIVTHKPSERVERHVRRIASGTVIGWV